MRLWLYMRLLWQVYGVNKINYDRIPVPVSDTAVDVL